MSHSLLVSLATSAARDMNTTNRPSWLSARGKSSFVNGSQHQASGRTRIVTRDAAPWMIHLLSPGYARIEDERREYEQDRDTNNREVAKSGHRLPFERSSGWPLFTQ
jgi:hypothetical protein